jgi:formylglycine-generating enzyme required for sulfatase activity
MDTLITDRALSTTRRMHAEVRAARAHTDALFALVADATLYERPIPDRHRLIFYLGHLDAFDWNQLAREVLDRPSFNPGFDRLFEAGIDPPPGRAPIDRPSDWPAVDAVRAYVARTRMELDEVWDDLPEDRVLMALEHRWMHAETLAYLLHQLEPQTKRAPRMAPSVVRPDRPADAAWVAIRGGTVTLGQSHGAFGWDNEFPPHTRTVRDFELARYKLTNGDYMRFVQAGGPAAPFWRWRERRWWLRRMFDEVPLTLDTPVYLTQRQATTVAAWYGARLPTEAEWHRAAYGDGGRRYPWGAGLLDASRSNANFSAWDATAVNAQPGGDTPEGVAQMLGNGWEWTSTRFAGFAGFAPRSYYPGYSADFFDGEHFVLKGASPQTAARLARPSFRNWFRIDYPYAYSAVRLARS